MTPHRKRFARVGLIVAMLVASVVGVAWAHAALVASTPAKDSHVGAPPRELRLVFSEAVNATTARVALVAPDSQRFPITLRADSADAKVLLGDVPALPVAGLYRVDWRLVGPDGHAVTGHFTFTIDSIPAPVAPASMDTGRAMASDTTTHELGALAPESPLQLALRFLASLALVAVIGSAAFARFVAPAAFGGSADAAGAASTDRRLRTIVVAGAWSLLGVALVRLTSQALALSGSASALRLGDFTAIIGGSAWGGGWVLQVIGALGLLVVLRPAPRVSWGAVAAMALVMAVGASFLGHPAASEPRALAMGLDSVHVLAAGGWVGGLLVMTTVGLPRVLTLPSDDRLAAVRRMLQAFSPLALTSAALLAVTGAVAAWIQLGSLSALFGSGYGQALIRKLVLVAGVAAFGAWHWRVVQPSMAGDRAVDRLRWSTALEVGLAAVVLILTAILTGTAPPMR